VKADFNPTLIITVDHGITAWEKVEYAKKLGIDIVVTDHHVMPDKLPDCPMVHTTKMSGSGISWFVAKEVQKIIDPDKNMPDDELAIASMGTIADMVALTGANRSITKYGLKAINETKKVGLVALMHEAGLTQGALGTYDVSHVLAPRLNAMGRLVHAMDALRLLCTKKADKADELAALLGITNKERQQLTTDTTIHARDILKNGNYKSKKLLFVVHESYNQGVIGLVAGKLMEEFYLPSIVVAKGEFISKASARSISGFNIVETIRSCSDILVDVGGHPMAAGFTIETTKLTLLQSRLEEIANRELDVDTLTRLLKIDLKIPFESITENLWQKLRDFEPFGFGNPEPVFASNDVKVVDARLVGADGKHLKLKVSQDGETIDAIAFGFGEVYGKLKSSKTINIAYTIDMNVWNGNSNLQLKIKDIKL
jgi:single-stranded-DNA-specific exonuclease